MKAYREKHGHLNVSKEEDSSLFYFCNNVRHGRRNPGKGMAITEERIATLDELGFLWGKRGIKQNATISFAKKIEKLKDTKRSMGI